METISRQRAGAYSSYEARRRWLAGCSRCSVGAGAEHCPTDARRRRSPALRGTGHRISAERAYRLAALFRAHVEQGSRGNRLGLLQSTFRNVFSALPGLHRARDRLPRESCSPALRGAGRLRATAPGRLVETTRTVSGMRKGPLSAAPFARTWGRLPTHDPECLRLRPARVRPAAVSRVAVHEQKSRLRR